MFQAHRLPAVLALCSSMALSACMLPEGAISLNAEISNAVRDQQVEFEKVIDWAFAPYYERLNTARVPVLENLIRIEKRQRAISHWRKTKVETVWTAMKDDKITGSVGVSRLEELKSKQPSDKEISSIVRTIELDSRSLDTIIAAREAKYKLAKLRIDKEKRKLIEQLKSNSANIVAANDRLTLALEKQKNIRLSAVSIAKSVLSIAAPALPILDELLNIVEGFGGKKETNAQQSIQPNETQTESVRAGNQGS